MREAARVLLGLSLVACGSDGADDHHVTVSDSAGIAIVTISSDGPLSVERWRVEAEPGWAVGHIDTDIDHTFDRVVGAATLADGSVAVADMGFGQVRLYDSTGRYIRSIGRAGSGPGEFRQVTGLYSLRPDLLVVRDRLEALHVYRVDGTYVSTHRTGNMPLDMDPVTMQLTPLPLPLVVGFLTDTSFLTTELTPIPLSPTREFTAPLTVDVIIKRGRLGGSAAAELLRLEGPTYHPHPMNLVLPAVHGPAVYTSAGKSGFVVANSGTGEVQWFTPDGTLERITRVLWPRKAVTSTMVDEYVQRSVPPLREELARGRTFAETLPSFSAVVTDAMARVWLRRYEPTHGATLEQYIPTFEGTSAWAIIGQDGRQLASVELPPRFTPLEIGADFILGIYRDQVDVESVRKYRLRSAS